MKKILLISPSYKVHKTSKAVLRQEPPIGLLNLASFIAEKGYECEIVNTAFEEIDWAKIKNGEYSLVGFTVFIGEFMKNTKEFSKRIKSINPKIPICIGGVMASLYPEEMLKEYDVDFAVRYEGEYTLFELLQYLEGKLDIREIKGLSYKLNGIVYTNKPRPLENDLDKLPVPNWKVFGKNYNLEQIPYYFRIMSSKGCPFQCSFCYSQSIDSELKKGSPLWRSRTASHVIAEIEKINRETKTTVFTFGDDNFVVNKKRVLEILRWMRKKGFYIEQCIAHLNNLDDEIIDAMGGIVQTVIYSIESASPLLQKLLNKNILLERIPEINRKLFKKGITTTHNFIIGLPTERDADLRMNFEMMVRLKAINPYVRSLCYFFLPLPCTPITEYVKNTMGLELPETLKDFEEASFDSGVEVGKKFRPWLDNERYYFLHKYCEIFNDVFQINNIELSAESKGFLEGDAKLRKIFEGVEKVNKPRVLYRPYVLDRVLKHEHIDLLEDLKKRV